MFKIVKTSKQIEKVSDLAKIIWHEAYKETLTKSQIEYMLLKFQSEKEIKKQINDNNYYYLIYLNKEAIGFFSYTISEHIYLSKIYILDNYRQKGYAKKTINFLKSKKLPIKLRVNKENKVAITSYEKLGFVKVEEIKSSIGGGFYMDDYVMERAFTFNDLLDVEKEKEYFQNLLEKIEIEKKSHIVFPKEEDWFKALELTPYENVKIVLIGQDPYFNKDQAMGLSFSVKKNIKKPPSLVNIYKEIESEYGKKMPGHGDLTLWAKQGVLLINAILTVNEGKPLSHQDFGWQIFTDEIIKLLQQKDFVVYLLLGRQAGKYKSKITNKNHVILETSHPSPLSSYRGFLGSGIFKKANELLEENNIKPINWYLL